MPPAKIAQENDVRRRGAGRRLALQPLRLHVQQRRVSSTPMRRNIIVTNAQKYLCHECAEISLSRMRRNIFVTNAQKYPRMRRNIFVTNAQKYLYHQCARMLIHQYAQMFYHLKRISNNAQQLMPTISNNSCSLLGGILAHCQTRFLFIVGQNFAYCCAFFPNKYSCALVTKVIPANM